jgi:protoporphyrinogen oxidase
MAITIYGAGVSGLFLGYFLKQRGMAFQIYEKSPQAGGKLGTLKTPYGPVEKAANGLLYSDLLQEVCNELNVTLIPSNQGLKRLVLREGQRCFQKAPALSFLEILRVLGKLGSATPIKSDPYISVKDFFTPLTGERFVDEVISTALGGIYASSAESLHLGSLLGMPQAEESYLRYFLRLKKTNRQKYFPLHKTPSLSGTVSFTNGMEELVEALAQYLKDHIHYRHHPPIANLQATMSFLCMPPRDVLLWLEHNSNALPAEVLWALKQYALSITMLPISTTTIFTDTPLPHLDQAFGVLFARKTKRHHLGILHNSAIFNNRTTSSQHFSYTFIASTHWDNPLPFILEDIKKIDPLWKAESIKAHYSFDYPEGIPLYDAKRVQAWEKWSPIFSPHIQLFTNYTHKIGLRDILHQAKIIVDKLPIDSLS